jgi:hypothetical protein
MYQSCPLTQSAPAAPDEYTWVHVSPPLVGQTTGTVFRLYGADQLPDTFSDL